MKSDLKILVAFLMNFIFSIAEFIGGFLRTVWLFHPTLYTTLEIALASVFPTYLKR